MNRPWLSVCAMVLLLGGCASASKADFMHHYSLGDSVSPRPGEAPQQGPTSRVLYLAPIAVPPWLEGTQMLYRLDYQQDARVAAYAHADWIAPPATLLQALVRNVLISSRQWQAVTSAGEPVHADASLHIQLDDFSQDFAQLDRSRAVIRATATLVDNRKGTVIGQKVFDVQVAAANADADGGAAALGQASRRFAAQLERWVLRADAPAR